MKWVVPSVAVLAVAYLTGCASVSKTGGTITKSSFGNMPDGVPVEIYTLRNGNGMEARICTYGGIVVSLTAPDRNGKFDDVVLGFDNLGGYTSDSYLKGCPYFGALIGRYGNRIGGAKFALGNNIYTLVANNGPNSLHGGPKGFDKVVWKARSISGSTAGPALELTYVSKDGEEGFPGTLKVKAVHTLTSDNSLRIDFTATTDKPTVCNLTHHSYFNLRGQGNGDILGHEVYINSEKTTSVDKELIPTGQYVPVKGTPFDFNNPTTIGARINDPDTQLQYGPGYDHNWVINKPLSQLGLQARVHEPSSGRMMEVWSTEPGLQFYTGNFLDGTLKGKGGAIYQRRTGFCMEPQHYPDSPNKPQFPSTTLSPGQAYENTIIYKFSVQ